jgi:hypothetical protein
MSLAHCYIKERANCRKKMSGGDNNTISNDLFNKLKMSREISCQ